MHCTKERNGYYESFFFLEGGAGGGCTCIIDGGFLEEWLKHALAKVTNLGGF